jgi:hypothetical protein
VNALEAVPADLGIADPGGLALVGDPRPGALTSLMAVAECAISSVVTCLMAASDLALARTGRRTECSLDTGHVAAAVRSEAWLHDPDGRGLIGFAPLSGLWPVADGSSLPPRSVRRRISNSADGSLATREHPSNVAALAGDCLSEWKGIWLVGTLNCGYAAQCHVPFTRHGVTEC